MRDLGGGGVVYLGRSLGLVGVGTLEPGGEVPGEWPRVRGGDWGV